MHRILLVLGALAMAPQSAAAQRHTASQKSIDAHAELFAVMEAGIDDDTVLDNLVASMVEQAATLDPNMAQLEAAFPGLMKDLGAAMRPVLDAYSQRVQLEYRPRLVAVLRETLTRDEALDAARFYRSEIGQVLLREISRQTDQSRTLADSLAERDVSSESVEADTNRTAQRTWSGITAEQRRELDAAAAATPALAKLLDFNSRSLALRTEMQNAPLTATEEAKLMSLIEEVVTARLAGK